MPSLDSCINSIYEPGFIPADPGITPGVPHIPVIFAIAATFQGVSSLRVYLSALGRQDASLQIPGTGSLRATGLLRQRIQVRPAGAGSLSVLITQKRTAASRPAGAGTLSVNATVV
jgi:hypothetical protein